jgi:molybdopterin-binding protein
LKEETYNATQRSQSLKGEIADVILGTVTALITVKVGENLVESVITKRSAEKWV